MEDEEGFRVGVGSRRERKRVGELLGGDEKGEVMGRWER